VLGAGCWVASSGHIGTLYGYPAPSKHPAPSTENTTHPNHAENDAFDL
jgi:hypothetical protein